jgi:hypothetical protein
MRARTMFNELERRGRGARRESVRGIGQAMEARREAGLMARGGKGDARTARR